jgi:group I intron endonuclease
MPKRPSSFYAELPTSAGVYKIVNIHNNFYYIGSSISQIRRRVMQHRADLLKNKHHSWSLQRDWNKFGESSFYVEVLLECSSEEALVKEQEFLNSRDKNKSYNILDCVGKGAMPEQVKIKVKDSLRNPNTTWSNNASGYRGVCFSKRQQRNNRPPWKASVHRNGKSYHIGYYETPRKAHNAYEKFFCLPDREFIEKVNTLKKHRGNGQRGSRRPEAKLSENDVRKIRKLYSSGRYKQKQLAERFGVDPSHISRIVNLKNRIYG